MVQAKPSHISGYRSRGKAEVFINSVRYNLCSASNHLSSAIDSTVVAHMTSKDTEELAPESIVDLYDETEAEELVDINGA